MVITGAGTAPNVVGLVYIAAWVPDLGESLGGLAAVGRPPPGGANTFVDGDGYLWLDPGKFGESFCQDLPAEEALVMAVTQKAPLAKATVTCPGPRRGGASRPGTRSPARTG